MGGKNSKRNWGCKKGHGTAPARYNHDLVQLLDQKSRVDMGGHVEGLLKGGVSLARKMTGIAFGVF